jgi:hypothetical protein
MFKYPFKDKASKGLKTVLLPLVDMFRTLDWRIIEKSLEKSVLPYIKTENPPSSAGGSLSSARWALISTVRIIIIFAPDRSDIHA